MKQIGGLFGRSPFGPLHEHMAKVQECVEKLPMAIEQFLARSWEPLKLTAAVIGRIEHEADIIKQGIRGNLSNSIFSSGERSEILLMLKSQDSVADRCEDVAYLFTMRRTPFPEFLKSDFIQMIAKIKDTVDRLTDVTRELHRAYDEMGSRSAAQSVVKSVEQIHVLEHDADVLEDGLREKLFDRESEVDPVTIMILLDIFRRSGNIADAAENVGDAIRMWIETR